MDYRIQALIDFVMWLKAKGIDFAALSPEALRGHAEAFWEMQHGDEHG